MTASSIIRAVRTGRSSSEDSRFMEQHNSADGAGEPAQEAHRIWRSEVQERVAGYRSRRGRRIEGAFSMRFPFPPAEAPTPAAEPEEAEAAQRDAGAASAGQDAVNETISTCLTQENAVNVMASAPATSAPEPTEFPAEEEFEPRPISKPRSKRKVIAFPRPATVEPKPLREDPLVPEQPRIFEVAEELAHLPTTPLLDGLQFPAQQQQQDAAPADHIELPLQAVALSRRLYAALVDCAVVGGGTGLFFAAAYKLLPKLTLTKPVLTVVAAIPLLLCACYQYLLLMYGGRTAGMQVAGLRLSSFKGGPPRWRQRRKRVIALYFSTASLMMGLLWALVDVDTLCWHDRISQTYVTEESSS